MHRELKNNISWCKSLFTGIYRQQHNKLMWNSSLILKVTIWKKMVAFFPWLNVNDGMHKVMLKHWNKHYKKWSSSEKGSKNQ